jgi:hypothetical protein
MTFRVVYYVPDPIIGARIPLGALVTVDGRTEVVRASLPGVDYLGQQGHAAASRLRSRLLIAESPYLVTGDARAIPDGVVDPVAWVAALF